MFQEYVCFGLPQKSYQAEYTVADIYDNIYWYSMLYISIHFHIQLLPLLLKLPLFSTPSMETCSTQSSDGLVQGGLECVQEQDLQDEQGFSITSEVYFTPHAWNRLKIFNIEISLRDWNLSHTWHDEIDWTLFVWGIFACLLNLLIRLPLTHDQRLIYSLS